MRNRLALLGVVLVAIALVVGWRLRGHGDTQSTSEATDRAGSASRGPLHVPATPASVAGRVTRKSDGAGIAGATVALARIDRVQAFERTGEPPLVASTDASGAWSLANVAPGEYAASANASGFVPGSRSKLAIGSGEHETGVDLALDAGGTVVHGTIGDFGGGPIAGARVAAVQDSLRSFTGGDPPSLALSDARGHYELSLADGDYRVTAGHDDYTSNSRRIELAGKPLTVDFSLVPGATVRGQVIARDTGKPVPGAVVRGHGKRRLDSGGGRDATSDADGKFLLRGLTSGAISIDAAARGYASASPTIVELGIGESIDGVRVVVDRARSITGRVVVKGTQQGIAGVHVGAFSMGGGKQAEAPDPSDDHGAFEIVGVRPGSYMLAALADDKMPEIGKAVEVGDKDVTGVVVEMAAGVTVSGRVEPPSRASIGISPQGEIGLGNLFEVLKAAFVQAETDAAGNFSLEHVPAGKFTLTATTREGPAGKLPIAVTGDNQSGLIVTLETRASIAGAVLDTNGKPVEGVRVGAMSADKDEMIRVSMSGGFGRGVTSAADGTFKIVGLEPGKYMVHAEELDDLLDMTSAAKKLEPIELAAGEARTGVTVTVPAHDGVIRGVVIGSDGQPAADSWVSARAQLSDPSIATYGGDIDFGDVQPVLTNGDGKFAIERLRNGTYTLVAEGPRGASHAEQKDAKPGDSVTLTLQPLGTLSGHVTLAAAAVPSFEIACVGPSGRVDRQVDSADGAYALEHLAPGHFTCDASGDGGTANGQVDVPPGSATLDLALQPYATIVGSVVSVLDGSPVIGAALAADGGVGGGGRQMVSLIMGNGPMTDASGHFEIDRVAPGTGKVMVMSTTSLGQPLATKPYTVTAGQRLDLGAIAVVPPRNGDAGTFGMATDAEASDLAVTAVSAGGPAAAAGIVVGDKITAIDGHAVTELTVPVAETIVSSGSMAVGQSLALTLARGATVTVTAAKW